MNEKYLHHLKLMKKMGFQILCLNKPIKVKVAC